MRSTTSLVLGRSPRRNRVSASYLKEHLKECQDIGVLEHLAEFGQAMLDETSARSETLEGKATSTLGWTAALLAFFVWRDDPTKMSLTQAWTSSVGALAAFGALVASVLALRIPPMVLAEPR